MGEPSVPPSAPNIPSFADILIHVAASSTLLLTCATEYRLSSPNMYCSSSSLRHGLFMVPSIPCIACRKEKFPKSTPEITSRRCLAKALRLATARFPMKALIADLSSAAILRSWCAARRSRQEATRNAMSFSLFSTHSSTAEAASEARRRAPPSCIDLSASAAPNTARSPSELVAERSRSVSSGGGGGAAMKGTSDALASARLLWEADPVMRMPGLPWRAAMMSSALPAGAGVAPSSPSSSSSSSSRPSSGPALSILVARFLLCAFFRAAFCFSPRLATSVYSIRSCRPV
mmetsp:Transcript_27143/g.54307  ORF Transcript_27143/g.54307 Transcript_27143/m.54307 type:complete len:290 (+) Transcript_27143:66-935(+)